MAGDLPTHLFFSGIALRLGNRCKCQFFGVFRSIVWLMPRCSSEPTAGWSVEGTGREVT